MAAKSLLKWVGYCFESSCSLTPEFAEFVKQMSGVILRL